MPSVRCPRCQTVVVSPAGTKPRCPSCSFPAPDSRAPAPAPPADNGDALATEPATSGMAVASLALGIASFIPYAGLVATILAIVLGILARNEIRERPHALKGSRMAAWGIGLGIAGFLSTFLLAALVFFLVSRMG